MKEPENSKVKIVCNHCNDSFEWYSSRYEEIGFSKILIKRVSKVYCNFCVNQIARFFVREAEL